jgi:hypothetical protein
MSGTSNFRYKIKLYIKDQNAKARALLPQEGH